MPPLLARHLNIAATLAASSPFQPASSMTELKAEPFQFPSKVPGCTCVVCGRSGVTNALEPTAVYVQYRLIKSNFVTPEQEMTEEDYKKFESDYPNFAEWSLAVQERVDPVALRIPDYFKIIKHPMDIGTINKRMEAGEYRDPEMFISDMRLVFRNAYVYNKKGTDVHVMAENLSQKFEQALLKMKGITG